MGWKENAERRWSQRTAPTSTNEVVVTVSAQAAIPRPAGIVWEFVWDPASSVLTGDNVVAGFTMPGTPVGEVGEVQVAVVRMTATGGLVGMLHEVVEVDPGRRAVMVSLSLDHQHRDITEVLPVGEDASVLRVTFEHSVPRHDAVKGRDARQQLAEQYVQRVRDILSATT